MGRLITDLMTIVSDAILRLNKYMDELIKLIEVP